jgi:hypothetical protein
MWSQDSDWLTFKIASNSTICWWLLKRSHKKAIFLFNDTISRWEAIRYTYIIALDDIKEIEDYYIVQKWLFCQNKWIKINGLSYHDYLFSHIQNSCSMLFMQIWL